VARVIRHRDGADALRKFPAAALLSASGFLLFGLDAPVAGYTTVAVALVVAAITDRTLLRDLTAIALGMVVISIVPLNADLSLGHMALMGLVLALAVALPYVLSRFVWRERVIRFPINTGKRWGRREAAYLVFIVVLGYFILPVYLIGTGVYQNWPDASEPSVFVRLFIGVNTVGIWDELFFVCTVFALLRRHFPLWVANLLQAVVFSSFLWEIGYRSWGPLLTFPFALLQGYTFTITKSLSFVVSVHLLFDLVLFLALVHAHNRDVLAIFVY
jgi:membrane protease YdiL (CAAX protease family)